MVWVKRLPLYLGFSLFALSVIFSALKLGEEKMIAQRKIFAEKTGARLSLKFTSPNLVSVFLFSPKEILGVDVALKFDPQKLRILPSTLLAGHPSFTLSGGIVEEKEGLFTFSALAKPSAPQEVILATFEIAAKEAGKGENQIRFETSGGKTAVLAKEGGENILNEALGVDFVLEKQ